MLTSVDRFLCSQNRYVALTSNALRHRQSFSYHYALTLAYNLADQTPLLCLDGREIAPRQDDLHGAGFTNGVRQTLGCAPAWDDAKVDFRLAEFRTGRGEDDVTHHREFATASKLFQS